MPRYDTVLLDADMTLFDFARSEREALIEVLEARGYPTDEETLALYLRINAALWAACERGEVDQDFLGVERFAAFMRVKGGDHDPRRFNRDYLEGLGRHSYLLPGAEDFCRAMVRGGLRLVIITNGLPAAQWGRLERSPLKELISRMFVSMEMGCQKPQREYFDRVCAELDITDRRRTVVVGDNLRADVQGALNAGLDAVWYNPQGAVGRDDVRPTLTAESYDEILKFLFAEGAQL